jgi:hypothetical protein
MFQTRSLHRESCSAHMLQTLSLHRGILTSCTFSEDVKFFTVFAVFKQSHIIIIIVIIIIIIVVIVVLVSCSCYGQ